MNKFRISPILHSYRSKKLSTDKSIIACEIGVADGAHAIEMLNFKQKFGSEIKKLYLVDPWDYRSDCLFPNHQYSHKKNYERVLKLKKKYPQIEIIKDKSINASKKFKNNYFDFIYIDGNHNFKNVYQDLKSWYPKLKKNGLMAGDDFAPYFPDVIKAVTKFAFEKKIFLFEYRNQFWFQK